MASLSATETQALRQFAVALRQRFGSRLQSLILFGSRARGEGREDSDLDILVELARGTRAERREVQDLAFDVGFDHRLVFSPVVVDPRTWPRDLPLAQNIAREGLLL